MASIINIIISPGPVFGNFLGTSLTITSGTSATVCSHDLNNTHSKCSLLSSILTSPFAKIL
jgi:hypothetical protein